jgi:hypothetical protein
MATWRSLLALEMASYGETLDDAVSAVGAVDDWLDVVFDAGYGAVEGPAFTVWTADRVYFPGCYDGAEGVDSVARNPNGQPTEHIGGG